MKLTVSLVMALVTISAEVHAQSNGFFGDVGDMIDDVFSTDAPVSRTAYRYQGERTPRSGAGVSGRQWSVVTVNGHSVATDANGLAVSHDKSGSLVLSVTPKSPIPPVSGPFEVSFSFNGSFFVSLPGRMDGQTVVVDEKKTLPLLVDMMKSKRSYEISTSFFKVSGTLSSSSKALDEVEQAARLVATIHNNTSQNTQVTINSTVIQPIADSSASVAALSESDQQKLDATADGVANLKAQIDVLKKMVENQQALAAKSSAQDRATFDATIGVINVQIQSRQKDLQVEDQKLQGYLTSITPNNRNQYLSARKASEIYPRVPYYIPGTPETGEFWVEPFVTEKGEQRFKFHFIDPEATNDVKRETIEMSRDELAQVQSGLFKLHEWSQRAQEQKIRKIFSKRATCFPAIECPKDGEQGELGKSSTEIRFQIYEDGATAGRIQRNKGRFEEGYNVSIDSAMLLQSYAAFVLKESDFDFKQGTQSKQELDALFQ